MSDPYETIAVDTPAPYVHRITLDRAAKRNAISALMRVELLTELRRADNDPDVRVSIIRGSGPCFSAGYDLRSGSLMTTEYTSQTSIDSPSSPRSRRCALLSANSTRSSSVAPPSAA